MKILVTGGSGFIGSHIVEHFQGKAITIFGDGDVKHSRASAERLLTAGWKPRHTLDEGLAETLRFFKFP